MIAVIQRVKEAWVRVDGREIARIGRGFLVLVGFEKGDPPEALEKCVQKVISLRVFEDERGKMNLGLDAVDGAILLVPNFTLAGDIRKGRRPSWDRALPPDEARERFQELVERFREASPYPVQSGVFQAHMEVGLVNDGPVTLIWRYPE